MVQRRKPMKRVIAAATGLLGLYLFVVKPSSRHRWLDEMKGRLYAHRGLHDNRGSAPENSLAAFAKAVENGYGIELDVQLSRDGIPVVFHDHLLKRAARDETGQPVNGAVSDYTLEELRRFHLFDSEEKIPLFSEVLSLVNGAVPIIVEIKAEMGSDCETLCQKADQLLSKYPGKYVVESFHPMAVLWYRRHRPEIIRGQLSDGFLRETGKLRYLPVEYLLTNLRTRPDFIAYNWEYEANPSRRIAAKLFHCPSVAWTIQSQDTLNRMRKKFDLLIFDSFIPGEEEV